MSRAIPIIGLCTLFLLLVSSLSANPIVHGYYIEKLPDKLGAKGLKQGKSLVLAQILNTEHKTMKAGLYEIGVEISTNGKSKKYILKPRKSISNGALTTFKMAVPVSQADKKHGSFRVFTKIGKEMTWSSPSSFLKGVHKSKNGITTLYTEAPPERLIPPPEVPFENAIKSPKAPTKLVKATPAIKHATKSVENSVKEVVKTSKTRKINSSEFKKLRTIDEELIIYVIKKGDSLKSIADKYYGNSNKEKVIADLNFIENPQSIKIGEEIIIDVKPLGSMTANPKQQSNNLFKQDNGKSYIIHSGDTLGKIALKFLGKSTYANEIIKANPGISPERLRVGTSITIPEINGDDA